MELLSEPYAPPAAKEEALGEEVVARLGRLEADLEGARQQLREQQDSVDRLRALCETALADAARRKRDLNQDEPARPPAPRLSDRWYVVYQKESGRMHEFQGTTAEVRRWYEEAGAAPEAAPRASRFADGPFDLLSRFPEFGDLPEPVAKPKPAAARPKPAARRRSAPPGTAHGTGKATASGRLDFLYWFLPTVLALISAVAFGQILFR